MVPREKSATESAFDSSFSSDPARKPRSSSFFSLPGLFVGSGKGTPDSDPARSPTSPLDCKVFSSLGSYLSRSPRSPHCERIGLGLVEALEDEPHHGCVRILSSATSPRSLPKNYVISSQTRVGSPLLRPSPPETAPGSPGARFLVPVKPGKTQPCSTDTDGSSFLARQNLDLVGGSISSLSAGDIEQSEDYTCIISRGPNPKTTHIFGDRILETTHTGDLSDFMTNKAGEEEGGSSSWMVTCSSEDSMPLFPSEDFLRACYSCKKKLEGKDIYMYRGEKAFCSSGCRSQEILLEEVMEDPATGSFASGGGSTSCEDIFLPAMDVAT